jgi:hypothetical protein
MNTVFPFSHIFNPCVWAVGNKERSVSSVGSVDATSWKYERLDLVTFSLQVKAHLLEYQPVIPINNSENVLAHDPSGTDLPNCCKHSRPEVSVVIGSFTLACLRERLAREAAGEDINASSPNREICVSDVVEVRLIREVEFEDTVAEGVYLARESVVPPDYTGGEVETSDAGEERAVNHAFAVLLCAKVRRRDFCLGRQSLLYVMAAR